MIRTVTPRELPAWFEPYTRWRFVGLPREFPGSLVRYPRPPFPRRITKEVQWVLDEWDRFALWSAWLDSGKSGPRPAGLQHAGWFNFVTGKPTSPGWAVRTRRLVARYRGGPPKPPPVFPPPVVMPPLHVDLEIGQSWVCMAEEPNRVTTYPAYMKAAWTADRSYERPTAATIAAKKTRRVLTAAWCDCHTTFPDEARHMKLALGLDLVIGEGESAAAFQNALDGQCDMAWINLSALTGAQKDAIRDGKIIVVNELYLNQDASRADRENWENLPVAGRLVATYDAKGEATTGQRFPMADYLRLGKYAGHHDSFYDPGSTEVDRGLVS